MMINATKKLLLLSALLSTSPLSLNSAQSMEAPYTIGDNTVKDSSSGKTFTNGETFIRGDDKRIFMITDIRNPKRYATYPTQQGNRRLTIQEVPGNGRCGDYALGISREEFKDRIKLALAQGDKIVEDFLNFVPVIEDLDKQNGYEFLEFDPTSSLNAHEGNITSTLQLAAYLFKLNLEIYVPDYDSLGEKANGYATINRVKLHFRGMYGDPQAPTIKVLHMGYLQGFRMSGNKHFRYLYDANNLEPWEEAKIEQLELANRKFNIYAAIPPENRTGKGEYEDICYKIIPIQAEGLKQGGQKKPGGHNTQKDHVEKSKKTGSHPVQNNVSPARNVTNSPLQATSLDDEREINEIIAEQVKERENSKSSDAQFSRRINELAPDFDKRRVDAIIKLVRDMYQSEGKGQKDGLERTSNIESKPVQNNVSPARNVTNSPPQATSLDDEREINEIIAEQVKERENSKSTDAQFSRRINELAPDFDKRRVDTVIKLVRDMYQNESKGQKVDAAKEGLRASELDRYARELGITQEELISSAEAVGVSPMDYYNMAK